MTHRNLVTHSPHTHHTLPRRRLSVGTLARPTERSSPVSLIGESHRLAMCPSAIWSCPTQMRDTAATLHLAGTPFDSDLFDIQLADVLDCVSTSFAPVAYTLVLHRSRRCPSRAIQHIKRLIAKYIPRPRPLSPPRLKQKVCPSRVPPPTGRYIPILHQHRSKSYLHPYRACVYTPVNIFECVCV